MTGLWLVLLLVADPPKEVPSVDAVRKAFKANLDRMANRRVKYVIVTLPGEPKKEFPPLDHPDRSEVEETWSKGDDPSGDRSHIRRTVFKGGSIRTETVQASDGKKFTSLKTETTSKGSKSTVDIGHLGVGHSELWAFEMKMRGLIEGGERERLGIRSAIKPSPHGGNLLELNPRVDDRSAHQERWTLDPSKNHWPVRCESDNLNGAVKFDQWHLGVVEFCSEPTSFYPKRVTSWNSSIGKTFYYTAVSVEFPDKLEEDAFAVVIPDGASVTDYVDLKTYKQGSGVVTPFKEPLQPGLAEDLRNLRKEDMLVYGGFVAAIVIVVGAAYVLMTRKRKSLGPEDRSPSARG